MKVIAQIPLLVFILLTYCAVALVQPSWLGIAQSDPNPAPTVAEDGTSVETIAEVLFRPDQAEPMFLVKLVSGATWGLTFGQVLIVGALILLFFEIFKSTRTNTASIIDHMLSTFVFILHLILFLVWDRAGTGVFFILTMITIIDVLCGFTVSISTARRDVSFLDH